MNDLHDDLDVASVRLFLTAAELGSVSKAAARHGLTQPSATSRIQKLERAVGVQLLERSPTGSAVTVDGQHLLSSCHHLVTAASALADAARSLHDQSSLALRLAITTDVANHVLPLWLAAEPMEDIELDIIEADTASIAAMLRHDEAEMGLLCGPGAPLALRSETVGWLSLMAVCHPTHSLANRKRALTGAHLTAADLILRRRGSGTLDVIEMALAQHELGVVGRTTEVSSTSAARLAAMNGAGVAILPEPAVRHDLDAGRLTEVRLSQLDIQQPVRLAWKGTSPSQPAARRLLDYARRRAVAA